jgi:signal transduction histidine kinase
VKFLTDVIQTKQCQKSYTFITMKLLNNNIENSTHKGSQEQISYAAIIESLKKLKAKEHSLQIINKFITSFLQFNTTDQIVWYVVKNVIAQLGYYDCVIYLLDSSGEYLIQRAAHGPKNPADFHIKNPIRIKLGEGIVGTVAKTGVAELINDTSKDPRYIIDDERSYSEVTVPIVTDSNKVIGIIDSEHPERNFFSESDLETLSTIASITAVKLSQAQYQEQLQRANEDLKQFLYAASHDLKEPLRMITCFSSLLHDKYASLFEGEALNYLKFLTEGANNMDLLVHDLINYIHLSKGQPRKLIDCNEVMNRVITNLNIAIKESNAIITYKRLPSVWGHFTQLMQLFQNLISNSIKYCTNIPPEIHISVREENHQYIFSVSDNGIGIAKENQDEIFQVFRKLHSRHQYAGTGIGLAACKKIAENLGGRIWVESEPGQGSTFSFAIPV